MNTKNLILVGGGGHCKSVIDVAESAGYQIVGVLDVPSEVGKQVLNYNVIGVDEDMEKYINDAMFVVTVGHIQNATLRIKLHNMIHDVGGRLATIIASTAYVSKYATLGEGTVVMHNAFVNANAKIGEGCIINTFANVEHDAILDDFCHISTGAMVNGNCVVRKGTFLGSQAVMANGVSISEGCVIAAGAFVRKNIKVKGVYADNPATLKIKL